MRALPLSPHAPRTPAPPPVPADPQPVAVLQPPNPSLASVLAVAVAPGGAALGLAGEPQVGRGAAAGARRSNGVVVVVFGEVCEGP